MKKRYRLWTILLLGGCLILQADAQPVRPEQAIFEVSNYLSLMGRYEEAAKGYDALLRYAPRSDVYHNAGINLALAGRRYSDLGVQRYTYPFERGISRSQARPDSARSEQNLRRAAAYLDQAIRQGLQATALVDYASVLALQGEYEAASHFARRAQRYVGTLAGSRRIRGFALAVEAICALELGQAGQSQALAHQAAGLYDLLVDSILHINGLFRYRSDPAPRRHFSLERIEGITPLEFVREEKARLLPQKLRLPGDGPPLWLYSRLRSHVYAYQLDWQTAYFLFTNPTYPSPSSGGIRIGDAQGVLADQYGAPRAIRRNQSGELWYYDEDGIIFRMGAKGHVEGWVTFFVH